MKKIKILLVAIFMMLLFLPNVKAEENLKFYLFYQESCPHCHDEMEFINSIKDEYPTVDFVFYEISLNEMNYNFYNKVLKKTKINANGVPFTIIGTDYYVGFNEEISKNIVESLNKFLEIGTIDIISMVKNDEDLSDIKYNENINENMSLPIIGEIDAKKVSLPLISIFIGMIDGFNPCAMWVLLFLIGMLFNIKKKKKMWILGITFLTTSAILYVFIMMAWLKVALSFNTVLWLRIWIALIALIAGGINIISYLKNIKKDDGCKIVDEKKRKKIFSKIKKITLEKRLILSIIGIITLAISVNLVELACSAGLPLMFTQILSFNNLSMIEYMFYMFLYILFFLIDDIIIFVIAMKTLSIKGISSKYGKYSNLIGGIIMILIGILMIFKPEWLMFNF